MVTIEGEPGFLSLVLVLIGITTSFYFDVKLNGVKKYFITTSYQSNESHNKMKTIQSLGINSNKRLLSLLLGAGIILLTFAVLQLTIGTGVDGLDFNWKLNDFIICGLLLFGTALLCEFVLRKAKTRKFRFLICIAILLTFALIWVDLSVGIFNIPGFSGN